MDKLSLLLWAKTKDGAKNRNRPKMILEMLQADPAQDIATFSTPELFEDMWEQLQEVRELAGTELGKGLCADYSRPQKE